MSCRTIATQKPGAETPNNASNLARWSLMPFRCVAETMPSGMAMTIAIAIAAADNSIVLGRNVRMSSATGRPVIGEVPQFSVTRSRR